MQRLVKNSYVRLIIIHKTTQDEKTSKVSLDILKLRVTIDGNKLPDLAIPDAILTQAKFEGFS